MSDQPELPQDAEPVHPVAEEPQPDPAPVETPPAEPEAAAVVHPELPPDHPLSYLGGEYRVLAGYIAALEAKLAKLGG